MTRGGMLLMMLDETYGRLPAWRIFWAMLDHDALHGGAIGHLRDLYRWTPTSSG